MNGFFSEDRLDKEHRMWYNQVKYYERYETERFRGIDRMRKRIFVIGGGASGLSAAIAAAENGASVTVLERLPRVGKKLLLTGNGRCNLGHMGFDFDRYHGSCTQAESLLRSFDTKSYFRKKGVLTRTDAEGRLYPYSGTAASVLDALRWAAQCRGVTFCCDSKVTGLRRTENGWQVFCGKQSFSCHAVVLAAGGCAAPSCGTDGNLFPWLKAQGHEVVPPTPALCPIPTDGEPLRALKGLRARARVTLLQGKSPLRRTEGEVQFTASALSGICVFDLAREISGRKSLVLSLDLLPEWSREETMALLLELLAQRGALPCGELLTGLFPKRLSEQLMKRLFQSFHEPANVVLREEREKNRLCALMHDLRFPVTGQADFQQAQVTAGGISGQSVTEHLESKKMKGLFFCGEILDLDGD